MYINNCCCDHPVTFFPSHSLFPSPFRQPPTVNEDEGKPPSDCGDPIPDEAFLMVTQRQWEDDIIYDSVPATQPITAQGQSIQMYNNCNLYIVGVASAIFGQAMALVFAVQLHVRDI